MAECMPLEGTSLCRSDHVPGVDILKCIICQKDQPNIPLTSTENGCKRVAEAAVIYDDIVLNRISQLKDTKFYYHLTNPCYKSYTLKKTLDKVRCKKEAAVEKEASMNIDYSPSAQDRMKTRSGSTFRTPASSSSHTNMLLCVVCGKSQIHGTREKFRICESKRAKAFLKAALFFQDDVYVRVSDLEEATNVFGADLYYHNACMASYLKAYKRQVEDKSMNITEKSQKRIVFDKEKDMLKCLIDRGDGLAISDIRDYLNEKLNESLLSNKEVKLFLTEAFGDLIQFCPSHRMNESLMVFSSELTIQDVVQKMRSLDAIKDAAKQIRKSLLDLDFGLKDKFCDAEELKRAWMSVTFDDTLLTFFSTLFNVKKGTFFRSSTDFDTFVDSETEDDDADIENMSSTMSICQNIRVSSICQMMHYNIHHGTQKSPMQIMTAHSVYEKCKSRELITTLNQLGASISYTEYRRHRNKLADYVVASCSTHNTPLPGHFVKDKFTIAAIDNFDHSDMSSLSGMHSDHDAVSTLFQVKGDFIPSKPNVSHLNFSRSHARSELACQVIKPYFHVSKKPTLPAEFEVQEEILLDVGLQNHNKDVEFALNLAKGGLGLHHEDNALFSWSCCRALISSANVPLMEVGFLPYIPHPITEPSTVYTAMHNFLDILHQLDQNALPVFCDEGVFHIVVDIMMHRPQEFKSLIPMLGSFHTAKVVQHCIGKYLKGSGVQETLVECGVFGVKTVESVLKGSHYVRSLRGILILAEVVEAMKWDGFWSVNEKDEFKNTLDNAKILQESLRSKSSIASLAAFQTTMEEMSTLKTRFYEYSNITSERSEMCQYWNGFLHLVQLLKNLIAADREGDWRSHIQTMQDLLPIFRQCDSINYLRYASWYVEKMRSLPDDHPDIYEKFLSGHFVIKQSNGSFNAVAPDMKLEQTIQRSKKSSAGIIGQTRQMSYVTEWELVYHEVLAISNAFRQIANIRCGYSETALHHELAGNISAELHRHVQNVYTFMTSRGNPYTSASNHKLHNFITHQIVKREDAVKLLAFHAHGMKYYLEFRNERFVTRAKFLGDTITKVKLPCFTSSGVTDAKSTKLANSNEMKDLGRAQRQFDIARSRGFSVKEILCYDLQIKNLLFDNDYTTKPTKHVLIGELENKLKYSNYQFEKDSDLPTAIMVDFMALIHRAPASKLKIFQDMYDIVWNSCRSVCTSTQIDFIFDSYLENSIKEGERQRRSTAEPINLLEIRPNTPIPIQMEKFWASSNNKKMLQAAAKDYYIEKAKNSHSKIILSGYVTDEGGAQDAIEVSAGSSANIDVLKSQSWEEADVRIIPHVKCAVISGIKRIVILSNDTDVVALLLYYIHHFVSLGLSEMWIRIGSSKDSMRFIPLHELGRICGPVLCSVIIKAHILTGCDVTSKIGTKAAAMKAEPEVHLQNFGEGQFLDDKALEEAEKYLIRVLQTNGSCKDFNELRHHLHMYKGKTINELPPTSHTLQAHILRCFYTVKLLTTLLRNVQTPQDPLLFGWYNENGTILPVKQLNIMPKKFTVLCGCKNECVRKCSCKRNDVSCTSYCRCTCKM